MIPPSALPYKELRESDSNAITGITIFIDLSQIKPGKTYLIVNFQSKNSSSQKGEIIKLIEVTSTLNETILSATIEVNLSEFDDTSAMYIQFVDQNYQNGSKVEERREIYFSAHTPENGVFIFENLEFVEGHAYKVYVGIKGSGDSFVINDSISGGGSTTDDDYNGIKDSVLRVKTNNSTIEINVKNEVVSLS